MTRRVAVAVALGAAAFAFAADDPNAPLANTKAQLQSLKKDEATEKADTSANPKLSLPTLAAPGPAIELPQAGRDHADTRDPKRAGQKDWLLDGFDRLDRKKSRQATTRTDDKTEDDEKPLDPNEPDYFLRVYERQRAERDARQLGVNGPSTTELKTDVADPFAPFLKDWLANSPVRNALKDVAAHTATGDLIAPAAEGPLPSSIENTAAHTRGAAPAVVAPNPFVQALGLPALDPVKFLETRGPTAGALSNPLPPPPAASANTIYDLPERPKIDLQRALPPPPSEDKKYFPQLKKF